MMHLGAPMCLGQHGLARPEVLVEMQRPLRDEEVSVHSVGSDVTTAEGCPVSSNP